VHIQRTFSEQQSTHLDGEFLYCFLCAYSPGRMGMTTSRKPCMTSPFCSYTRCGWALMACSSYNHLSTVCKGSPVFTTYVSGRLQKTGEGVFSEKQDRYLAFSRPLVDSRATHRRGRYSSVKGNGMDSQEIGRIHRKFTFATYAAYTYFINS
jgi:hypothetical protein